MSARTPPNATGERATILSRDFYTNVAHEMDPSQEITPEAVEFLNDISQFFLQSVIRDVASLRKSPDAITPEDVYYILQSRHNMLLPGPTGPLTTELRPSPTAEYQEKLHAVRAFAASHTDD